MTNGCTGNRQPLQSGPVTQPVVVQNAGSLPTTLSVPQLAASDGLFAPRQGLPAAGGFLQNTKE